MGRIYVQENNNNTQDKHCEVLFSGQWFDAVWNPAHDGTTSNGKLRCCTITFSPEAVENNLLGLTMQIPEDRFRFKKTIRKEAELFEEEEFERVLSLIDKPAKTEKKVKKYVAPKQKKQSLEEERAMMVRRCESAVRTGLDLLGFDENLIQETVEMEKSMVSGQWYRALERISVKEKMDYYSRTVKKICRNKRVQVLEEFDVWMRTEDGWFPKKQSLRIMTDEEVATVDPPPKRQESFGGVKALFGEPLTPEITPYTSSRVARLFADTPVSLFGDLEEETPRAPSEISQRRRSPEPARHRGRSFIAQHGTTDSFGGVASLFDEFEETPVVSKVVSGTKNVSKKRRQASF